MNFLFLLEKVFISILINKMACLNLDVIIFERIADEYILYLLCVDFLRWDFETVLIFQFLIVTTVFSLAAKN